GDPDGRPLLHHVLGRDPGLKQIDDATDIRCRLLLAFEHAETCSDDRERMGWLTFVVVGGGPTGVELAGAIAELARHGLTGEFSSFDPASTRVLLIQGAPRLLPPFPESLSAVTQTSLEALGVEVMLDSFVDDIDETGVVVKGQRVACRTVFWAAGVAASLAARWHNADADRTGQLKVEAGLAVRGLTNVFAIGDTALSMGRNGNPFPGLAPAAKQQGAYVAKVIRARLEGDPPPAPFVYHHLGNLATIGRGAAVVDFGWLPMSGGLAWWLWGLVHVAFLVDARSRLSVALEWFWSYIPFNRSIRLITGEKEPRG
ncbi:MAG: FAD-dependent oxidoreductase, partial [Rhodospirillaceae bacterium]